jgi:S-adenosylmethionine hydrolase
MTARFFAFFFGTFAMSQNYPGNFTHFKLHHRNKILREPFAHRATIPDYHFGNAITNIPSAGLKDPTEWSVKIPGQTETVPVVSFYQSVPPGKAAAIAGSHGYLEIAVSGDSAQRRLRLKLGSTVTLMRRFLRYQSL